MLSAIAYARARTHTQKPQLFIKLPVIYHQMITRYRNIYFGQEKQTRAVGAPLSVQENLLFSLVPYSEYNVWPLILLMCFSLYLYSFSHHLITYIRTYLFTY